MLSVYIEALVIHCLVASDLNGMFFETIGPFLRLRYASFKHKSLNKYKIEENYQAKKKVETEFKIVYYGVCLDKSYCHFLNEFKMMMIAI